MRSGVDTGYGNGCVRYQAHRLSSYVLYHYAATDWTTLKIKCISMYNIIVRKLDYHTSEEPVDLFLMTLLVCTRQQ